MNETKTLKEVCEQLGITRRAIQGYQSKGLLKPDGRNKYGHLLFETKTVHRIGFIHFCQMLNFTLDEISNLIDQPSEIIKEQLKGKLVKLKETQCHINTLMSKTEMIIEQLNECMEIDEIYEMIQGKDD